MRAQIVRYDEDKEADKVDVFTAQRGYVRASTVDRCHTK